VVTGLLEELVDRGLDMQRRYLVLIDGSKALRAGVERVFGDRVEVQRCQVHKRRNVKECLPENCQCLAIAFAGDQPLLRWLIAVTLSVSLRQSNRVTQYRGTTMLMTPVSQPLHGSYLCRCRCSD
jgi:hypothetical protein